MISDEKLIELYTAMVQCRFAADLGARSKSANGTSPTLRPVAEAILAGIAVDLDHSDRLLHADLAPSKRNGHRPIESLIQALAAPRKVRAHLPAQSVGSPAATFAAGDIALHKACESARTHKTQNRAAITVAFCDGVKTTSATWKKSLERASKQNLPVLFVAPLETLPGIGSNGNSAPKATIHGVPVIAVDGHDVVAVYRVASESIVRARQRRGPTVIATALLDLASDQASEDAAQLQKRPKAKVSQSLHRMEAHLKEQSLFRAGMRTAIEQALRHALDAATGIPSA